jgi:hypothetical protein
VIEEFVPDMLIIPELPTELDIEGVPNTGAPIALV